MPAQVPKVAEASRLSFSEDQRRDASATFPANEQEDYLEAWQNVDSKEGVPLAVARKAFGNDPEPIIEELNEVLVA